MPYMTTMHLMAPYFPKEVKNIDQERLDKKPSLTAGRLLGGRRKNPDNVPRAFYVSTRRQTLPGMFQCWPIADAVSEQLRNKIEELEPGVHQFFPIELELLKGERPDQPYYLLNIMNVIDAIDPEKSVSDSIHSPYSFGTSHFWNRPESKRNTRIVLYKNVIAGMCIWNDVNSYGDIFMSDELYDFIKKNKLTRLDAHPATAE